ncbi:hypothetical protein HYU16_00390 [Candidatus Woesearchaeota archaeon]|nr:hypothetical protein [Candidatus Woesearchaeota archaeon]
MLQDLSGIELFERADSEKILAAEEGTPGQSDHFLAEYYVRTGEMRFILTVEKGGELEKKVWTYYLPTGSGYAPGGSLQDEDLTIIQRGIRAVEQAHHTRLSAPPRKDLEGVLRDVTHRETEDITDSTRFSAGDCILVQNSPGEIIVAKVSKAEVENIPGIPGKILRLYTEGDSLLGSGVAISNGKVRYDEFGPDWWPSKLKVVFATGFEEGRQAEGKKVWKISEAEARILAKYVSAIKDPTPASSMNRSELVTYAALQSLQYERWGLDEIEFLSRGNEQKKRRLLEHRYKDVTAENYGRAIDTLVERVGEGTFVNVAKKIFEEHLRGLHTKLHLESTPFQPHSDIGPLSEMYTKAAHDAIRGVHPVPRTMEESGFVVNVKTLFGDPDFWAALRTRHAGAFNELVDYVEGLPHDFEQRNYGARTRIDPVALVQQYFPNAHAEITGSRPDFTSATPKAIRVVGKN